MTRLHRSLIGVTLTVCVLLVLVINVIASQRQPDSRQNPITTPPPPDVTTIPFNQSPILDVTPYRVIYLIAKDTYSADHLLSPVGKMHEITGAYAAYSWQDVIN